MHLECLCCKIILDVISGTTTQPIGVLMYSYDLCRAMQGSYSIKYVLPALFPDDPSLDYHNLAGVHNGSEASATFKRMAAMSRDELEAYRTHLLNYCGLDTFAMVKVWEKLNEVVGIKL